MLIDPRFTIDPSARGQIPNLRADVCTSMCCSAASPLRTVLLHCPPRLGSASWSVTQSRSAPSSASPARLAVASCCRPAGAPFAALALAVQQRRREPPKPTRRQTAALFVSGVPARALSRLFLGITCTYLRFTCRANDGSASIAVPRPISCRSLVAALKSPGEASVICFVSKPSRIEQRRQYEPSDGRVKRQPRVTRYHHRPNSTARVRNSSKPAFHFSLPAASRIRPQNLRLQSAAPCPLCCRAGGRKSSENPRKRKMRLENGEKASNVLAQKTEKGEQNRQKMEKR